MQIMDSVAIAVGGTAYNNCNSSNGSSSSSSSSGSSCSSCSSSSSGYGSANATPTVRSGSSYELHNTNTTQRANTNSSLPLTTSSSGTAAAVVQYLNEPTLIGDSAERQRQYYQHSYTTVSPILDTSLYSGLVGSYSGLHDSYLSSNVSSGQYQHRMESSSPAFAEPQPQQGTGRERYAALKTVPIGFESSCHQTKTNDNKIEDPAMCSKVSSSNTKLAAAPFCAQPSANASNFSAAPYYDAYKHKMPTKLSNTISDYGYYSKTCTGSSRLQNASEVVAAAASYQQQQYYVAAKSQLQEVTYGGMTSFAKQHQTSSRHYASTGAFYPTNKRENQTGSTPAVYYDKFNKYITPINTPIVMSSMNSPYPQHSSPHYRIPSSHEIPTEMYRKSSAWHWNMECPRALAAQASDNMSTTNTSACSDQTPSTNSAQNHFYGKYDKYNSSDPTQSSYYQPYMSPDPISKMWSGRTHQQRHSHLTTSHIQSSNERLHHMRGPIPVVPTSAHSHTGTSLHYLTSNNTNVRSYCTQQPYQPQNNNNARTTSQHRISNTYVPPLHSQHCNYMGNSIEYGKYSTFATGYIHNNKIMNGSDINIGQQVDSNTSHLNYNYNAPTSRYDSCNNTTGDPLSLSLYNDLSISGSYNRYPFSPAQPVISQKSLGVCPADFFPQYPLQSPKSVMSDYQKEVASYQYNTDYAMSSQNKFLMTPLAKHTEGRVEYNSTDNQNPVQNSARIEQISNSLENTEKETTKNLSLRDFLSTWNEDEEDFINNEELNFIQTQNCAESNNIVSAATTPQVYKTSSSTSQQIQEKHVQVKTVFNSGTRPKIHVGITVDSSGMDVETNQYINLPDIIIDIEKSNNISATTASKESFDNFNMEMKIDELKSKSKNEAQSVAEFKITKENNSDKLTVTDANESNNLVKTGNKAIKDTNCKISCNGSSGNNEFAKSVTPNGKSNENSLSHFDSPEQFLKQIEADKGDHSNQSTFEKEYETFINKINSDNIETKIDNSSANVTNAIWMRNKNKQNVTLTPVLTMEKVPSPVNLDTVGVDQENDIMQNIKKFSKFHKRKRKLFEAANCNEKKSKKYLIPKTCETIDLPNNNDTETRPQNTLNLQTRTHLFSKQYKKKVPLLRYQKILKTIYGQRCKNKQINTNLLLQKRIIKLRDRRLPLIKRQYIKRYSNNIDCTKSNIFDPKSLKALSVFAVNSTTFRQRILKDYQLLSGEKLTSQEESKKQPLVEQSKKDCNIFTTNKKFNGEIINADNQKNNLDCLNVPKQDFQVTDETFPIFNDSESSNLNNDLEDLKTDHEDSTFQQMLETKKRNRSNNSTSSASSNSSSYNSNDSCSSNSSNSNESKSRSCSRRTSMSVVQSDFNELEALKKDLTQHHCNENKTEQEMYTANFCNDKNINSELQMCSPETPLISIANSDIIDIKRILESDHEESDDSNSFKTIAINAKPLLTQKPINTYVSKVDSTITPTTKINQQIETTNSSNLECIVLNKKKSNSPLCDVDTLSTNNLPGDNDIVCSETKTFNVELESTSDNMTQHICKETINKKNEKINNGNEISKLSDLCEVALNQSTKSPNEVKAKNISTKLCTNNAPSHELSVEEALAEMYRQAGVSSDLEDNDEKEDAQEVVLINLEEILDGDSDVYVLQCDMDENVVSVVASHESTVEQIDESQKQQ